MLVDSDRMAQVLERLIDLPESRASLLAHCDAVAKAVRDLPPTKTPSEALRDLQALGEMPMDWDLKHDVELRRRLRALANDLDRMRKLKRGGVDTYTGPLCADMRSLLERLRAHGLFLVPVGELEEWLPQEEVAVSRNDKRAWANAAAQVVQGGGKREAPLWSFMRSVGRYLAENPARIRGAAGV